MKICKSAVSLVTVFALFSGLYATTVRDVDGNVYNIVAIGSLEWTAENARTTRYNCGTPLPQVKAIEEWNELSTPAFSYYNNTTDRDSIEKFGALYNWWVVSTENPRQIAPKGWRVPTDDDWDVLANYLVDNGHNWDQTTSGFKIGSALASSAGVWSSHGETGDVGNDQRSNNSSGFAAVPAGSRCYFGHFDGMRRLGYWWSSTERSETFAFFRYVTYRKGDFFRESIDKGHAFSLRFVRDR